MADRSNKSKALTATYSCICFMHQNIFDIFSSESRDHFKCLNELRNWVKLMLTSLIMLSVYLPYPSKVTPSPHLLYMAVCSLQKKILKLIGFNQIRCIIALWYSKCNKAAEA